MAEMVGKKQFHLLYRYALLSNIRIRYIPNLNTSL